MPERQETPHRPRGEWIESLRPTLTALLRASVYAHDTDSEIWEFAVSINRLHDLGASEADLRWLVKKRFVAHGREVTIEGDDGREFRPTGNLTFSQNTCFVLTEAGIELAQSFPNRSQSNLAASSNNNGHTILKLPKESPVWDANLRKLHLCDQLVKHFKWPAMNQEAVLCAFEEEGWPERIDDPLPPQPEQDPKRRLADTIKCLNRKQVNNLLHFRGDGTGEGVVWERIEESPRRPQE